MFPNFIHLLKLVAFMENWLPVPTPPFGESALSSCLVQLQYQALKISAVQAADDGTKMLETMAGILRKQVTQLNQFQSDVTNFLELIESHRPLEAHEIGLRDAASMVAQSSQESDAELKVLEQTVARIKNRRSEKMEEDTTDVSGAANISEAVGGTDPFVLMIL